MKLNRLATMTTAGTTKFFTYIDPEATYVSIAADGYFDAAADSLEVGAVINSVGSDGLSIHLVTSITDGVVATGDFLFALATSGTDIDGQSSSSFQGLVALPNKITRAEIETTILTNGYDLPSGKYSFTIFINDITRPDNMYLCRYDKVQAEWYQELIKKAI